MSIKLVYMYIVYILEPSQCMYLVECVYIQLETNREIFSTNRERNVGVRELFEYVCVCVYWSVMKDEKYLGCGENS